MAESENETLLFPFLGILESGECFEYLLLNIEGDLIEICIAKWLVSRTKLNEKEKIDLYVPQMQDENERLVKRVLGTVISSEHSDQFQGEVYKIQVSHEEAFKKSVKYSLAQFIQKMTLKESLTDLFIFLIKDSMILKQGIRVYWKHLIPYFSRIANYPHDQYAQLEKGFLEDIMQHIKANETKLEKLYQQISSKTFSSNEIPVYLNLEELREIFESEISLNLFYVVFAEQDIPGNNSDIKAQNNYGFAMYINAIKNLEKRIYANFNSLVIIYLKSLQ